jgi:hypothetical protein
MPMSPGLRELAGSERHVRKGASRTAVGDSTIVDVAAVFDHGSVEIHRRCGARRGAAGRVA